MRHGNLPILRLLLQGFYKINFIYKVKHTDGAIYRYFLCFVSIKNSILTIINLP